MHDLNLHRPGRAHPILHDMLHRLVLFHDLLMTSGADLFGAAVTAMILVFIAFGIGGLVMKKLDDWWNR